MSSALPAGWKEVKLRDVIQPSRIRGNPQAHPEALYVGLEHVEPHTMRLVGSDLAGSMRSAAMRFYRGEVLYGRLRPYLNKVYHASMDGLCSAEFIVFPQSSTVDSRFLAYRLNASDFVEFATRLNEGDRPRVDFPQMGSFAFLLPPIEEQRRIVAALEEHLSALDAAVAGLRRARANLIRWEASELVGAISGSERRAADAGDAARWPLPTSWSWVRVQDVGHVLLGRQRAPQYLTGRYPRPYLRVANIGDDFLRLNDVKEMDFDAAHFAKYSLVPGDILVSEGQSPELVGQSAIYRGEVQNACFQKTLHRFRADPAQVLPEFAQIVFRAYVKSGVFQRFASLTVNIAHLTLERFREVPFPLPPLAEQRLIVNRVHERITQARRMAEEIDLQLARAARMRQSILQHAFSGRSVGQHAVDDVATPLVAAQVAAASDRPRPRTNRRSV